MNCDEEYCEGRSMDEHPVYDGGELVSVEYHCAGCGAKKIPPFDPFMWVFTNIPLRS